MNPRRLARPLALLAVVVVTAWLFSPRLDRPPAPVAPPSPPATYASPPPAPAGPPSPQIALLPTAFPVQPANPRPPAAPGPLVAAAPPATGASSPPSLPGLSPVAATAVAVDQVRLMLRDYRTLTGENPVGTNAEILRALMGDNPRQARLGPPQGQALNADGELVDRWDTPLFFHQLSGTVTEIRSAGPDKILWTDDDIVTR